MPAVPAPGDGHGVAGDGMDYGDGAAPSVVGVEAIEDRGTLEIVGAIAHRDIGEQGVFGGVDGRDCVSNQVVNLYSVTG